MLRPKEDIIMGKDKNKIDNKKKDREDISIVTCAQACTTNSNIKKRKEGDKNSAPLELTTHEVCGVNHTTQQ